MKASAVLMAELSLAPSLLTLPPEIPSTLILTSFHLQPDPLQAYDLCDMLKYSCPPPFAAATTMTSPPNSPLHLYAISC